MNLLQLELGFTEELLALREDKITLMEEHNKALERRFQVERELTKIKKKN